MTSGGVVEKMPGGKLPGAIIAAAGALTSLIGGFFKPDLTKIQATQIVDQIEAQTLKPMRASWQALPASQKTVSMQAAYLAVFDAAWQAVVKGCSNPALGTAGGACISDREQGSCVWTLDGQTPGIPPSNCGNWFQWYRVPIESDPDVHPDPVAVTVPDAVTSAFSSFFGESTSTTPGTGNAVPLLIGGALIAFNQ